MLDACAERVELLREIESRIRSTATAPIGVDLLTKTR
jgi:hypothetical protein